MIAKLGIYEKALAENIEWVSSPNIGYSVLESGHQDAEIALQFFEGGEGIAGSKKTKSCLGFAATWHFFNAAVQLEAGNPEGWRHYEKSLHLSVWEPRIRIRLYRHLNPLGDRYKKPGYFGHAKHLIGGLAHPGEEMSVCRIGEYFLSEATETDLTFDMYGERLPELNSFILWLYCQSEEEDWEERVIKRVPLSDMGVFQSVVDAWKDEHALEKALSGILDVHLARLEVKQQVYSEFHHMPFSLIPTEYYAIKNVRAKLGLNTPQPKHRLLEEGLFGEMPEKLPKGEDTIFDEAIRRVQELFPDV